LHETGCWGKEREEREERDSEARSKAGGAGGESYIRGRIDEDWPGKSARAPNPN